MGARLALPPTRSSPFAIRPQRSATIRDMAPRNREGTLRRSRPGSIAMLTRRHLIALSAAQAATTSLLARAARAQTPTDFPTKPVQLIVPVAAGGPTDIVARMLADRLSSKWGQQVVVENKGGAGTNIGNDYV